MLQVPWSRAERGVNAVVERWSRSHWVKPCFCADELLAGADARAVPFPSSLDRGLMRALRDREVNELYVHQARAFDAARSRRGVVVATPTASGKSLCFHLPVLQALSEDHD